MIFRSEEYLDFIRINPCWVCRSPGPSEPHHWGPDGGMSLKCSDHYTTPLCKRCHHYWHLKGHFHELDRRESEAVQIEAQRFYMGLWIRDWTEETNEKRVENDDVF